MNVNILAIGLVLALLISVQFAKAQQTYFNVPSADIVGKHEVAAQQQVNIAEFLRSTTTVEYGLGREWEVGVNLYNLDYQPSLRRFDRNDSTAEQPYSPLVLVNALKAFDLNHNLEFAVGAQVGLNLTSARRPQWVGFFYTHLGGSFQDEHYNWSVGAYTANSRYLGEGPKAGFMAGFDAGIFYQKLHLLGDWTSGSHEMGQLALGLEVYLSKHFPLAVGWQRANQDGAQALIIQLTYNPE